MYVATTVLASPAARPWAILATLLVLAAVAAIEPRVVPRGHWLVVLRSGRTHRVLAGGLAIRVPLLERYVWLPRACTRRPFVVTARSQDGVEVRVSGEIGIRIVDPAVAVENALSPLDLALDEAERALIRTVARCGVTALAELPPYLELAIEIPGIQVTPVDLGNVEIALSPFSLRTVAHQEK
ncbi:SPFH domain-containing protein [Kribbella sp. NBC_00482]|uniref:SPFH domain-containing protein n=1 Tax=Kribbella sp. NBC_00482 TaxID=2975968 RepID=UPI002E16ED60